jgi:hypothetical protein
MFVNAFAGSTLPPADEQLNAALGDSRGLWDQVVAEVSAELDGGTAEWHSYSPKAGWSLRLRFRRRNIVYLVPHTGGFQVAFVMGDRAIAAVRATGFSPEIMRIIAGAPRYPEGTGFRLEVKFRKDVEVVRKLVQIKLAY